jgi:type II secretory pathway pseudopilin PulG
MLEAIPEGPFWLQVVVAVIGGLVTTFLIPYLRSKKKAAEAEAANQDLNAMGELVQQVKVLLIEEAGVIAEQRFPKIAMDVVKGEIKGPAAIKAELKVWGEDLRDRAKRYFSERGIDVVGAIGDEYLDRLIRWAADQVSPFPGKATAVTLFEKEWSNKLVKYGVEWVKERYLNGDSEDDS